MFVPEGPTILHLRDELLPFKGKVVKKAGGYGPMPAAWIKGKKLKDILTWGKHLLFVFANGAVRVHLGLFGDILVNDRKKVNRSFFLEFQNGEINGYVVKARKIDGPLNETYDWRTDILSPHFDKKYVRSLLRKKPDALIADVLVDQDIFTGSGNIIRNEALYRAGIHPLSHAGSIPPAKISKLLNEVVRFSKLFYQAYKKNNRKEIFQVYQREFTESGDEVQMKILPKTKRKVFFSERQGLYV